jgi:hypothetical protein
MLETITAGLLLASISGISYLAYKHPLAYRKVFLPLLVLSNLIGLILVVWGLGVTAAYLKLIPFLESSKWAQERDAVNSILPRWWLVAGACLGANTYLGFLNYGLPKLLEEKKESPDEPRSEKEEPNV